MPKTMTTPAEGLYFDNAAAMPVTADTLAELQRDALRYFANQEASGAHAMEAKQVIARASAQICSLLCGCASGCSVFWSNTGTDVLSAAVKTMELACPGGGTVLYTAGEHGALSAAIRRLPNDRFSQIRVKLLKNGLIDPADLERRLIESARPPVLLALHHVQPETGVIQNLPQVRQILDRTHSRALFLADTIQSAGKLAIPWEQAKLDFITVSGQKIGALAGAALIVRAEQTSYPAAAQLRRLRSEFHTAGRPAPALILSAARCLALLVPEIDRNAARVSGLKRRLLEHLAAAPDLIIRQTVPQELASPYILHLLADGRQGAILSRTLAQHGISVAPGSACNAETDTPSEVLSAMGWKTRAFEALRISFSPLNTPEETDLLTGALAQAIREY